jgi:NAD(P)-dependent dehydrogenase (short-subunit alcohol dehydrogenase family)
MAWFEDFGGKCVIVTGASSGIGRETALAFGSVGAHVVLVARRRGELDKVAEDIRASGGKALVAPADVTHRPAVYDIMLDARDAFGRVDLVVNNAGVLIPSPVESLEPADLDAMLKVNLYGALFVMQAAVRQMREQGGEGTIVNVASLAGRRGVTPLGGYCATKFALVGVTEALRTELRDTKIHVALVLPGVIETPMAHGGDADLENLWPSQLNMPPSWVVWAIFAAARFRLVEISVPPGAATLEKVGALAPGITDSVVYWGTQASQWLSRLLRRT